MRMSEGLTSGNHSHLTEILLQAGGIINRPTRRHVGVHGQTQSVLLSGAAQRRASLLTPGSLGIMMYMQ